MNGVPTEWRAYFDVGISGYTHQTVNDFVEPTEWRAYFDVGISGYTHQTVNETVNDFVDPVTGAHTQSVEGHWSCTKRMMRKQGVMNTSSNLFPTYLIEFLWRRRFGALDVLEKLLESIAEQYPL